MISVNATIYVNNLHKTRDSFVESVQTVRADVIGRLVSYPSRLRLRLADCVGTEWNGGGTSSWTRRSRYLKHGGGLCTDPALWHGRADSQSVLRAAERLANTDSSNSQNDNAVPGADDISHVSTTFSSSHDGSS